LRAGQAMTKQSKLCHYRLEEIASEVLAKCLIEITEN